MRRVLVVFVLTLGSCAAAVAAAAAPITFEFRGSVNQVNADPLDPFGGAIAFGSSFTGRYTFDSDALDGIAGDTDGSYASFGAPFGVSVDFDGDPFGAFSIADFVVVNTRNGSPDQYGVFGIDGLIEISLLLESFTNPLSDDLLPVLPPDMADFASRLFTFRGDVDGNQVEVLGTIDSIDLVAVPEPGVLALVSFGLAAKAARRRRLRPTSGR